MKPLSHRKPLLPGESATSTIVLAGVKHTVHVDPYTSQRFIDGEEVHAFVQRMTLLGRTDVIEDLASVGKAAIKGTLLAGSPQMTAYELHSVRRWGRN